MVIGPSPTLGRHALTSQCIDGYCCRAPLLEQGCGIGPGKDRSQSADILIPNWSHAVCSF